MATLMPAALSFDKANELLDQAVAEMGADYVYPGAFVNCTYTDTKHGRLCPSCLIGRVFAAFCAERDLEHEALTAMADIEGSSCRPAARRLGISMDSRTGSLLERVQRNQDTGGAWGDAVGAARRWIERNL